MKSLRSIIKWNKLSSDNENWIIPYIAKLNFIMYAMYLK